MGAENYKLLNTVLAQISDETSLNHRYLHQEMQELLPINKSVDNLSIEDLREMAIRFLDELFFDLEEKH